MWFGFDPFGVQYLKIQIVTNQLQQAVNERNAIEAQRRAQEAAEEQMAFYKARTSDVIDVEAREIVDTPLLENKDGN